MEKIEDFLKVGYGAGTGAGSGYGSGYGYGDGAGYGHGYGAGYGAGYGYGYGDGSGDGDGAGYGYGYGAGYGAGSGYGDGDGSGAGSGYGDGDGAGDGYGDGAGLNKINGMIVYLVDGIQTIITTIKNNNIAKGFILNDDLTLNKCFVVKRNNLFAHGETLHDANQALNDKLFDNMSEEERIEEFLNEFEIDKKYPVMKFFDWHNRLTGSCEMGRKTFAKNHNIDLEHDELTVCEFIELTKNDYGGEVIKMLEEALKA